MNPRPGSPPADGDAVGGPPSQADPARTDPPQADPAPADPVPGEAAARSAAERIIDRFGGIRPMATKLRVPVTTVQGWKKRGAIPTLRHGDILVAASRYAIVIDPAELEASTPEEERPGAGAAPVADALPPPPPPPDPEPAATAAAPPLPEPEPPPLPPSPPPATATGPVPARGGAGARNAAVVFALVALIGAGVAATAPLWSPYFNPAQDPAAAELPARLGHLEQQVAALEQPPPAHPGLGPADLQPLADRIAALEARPVVAPDPDLPARITALEPRITALEQGQAALDRKLADLDQRLGAALQAESGHLTQDLAEVDSRVASLDQAITRREAASAATAALVLAGGQLRAALQGDQPFQAELTAVRAGGGQALSPELVQALDAVAPAADTGIPTRATLTERFAAIAGDAVRAGRGGGSGTDWGAQALAQMQSLVTVRRSAADAAGADADATVARADARLHQGDLAAAADQIAQLTGPAAAAAAGWLRDARARIAADHAATLLAGEALARLRQDAATAAPAKVTP